jgi:hypothetical protein
MKKFSKKSVLLFAAAMAVCAFAMPSMASAASWSPINSEHTLDSANTGFSSAAITSVCSVSQFTATVNATGSALSISSALFRGCTATGPAPVGVCTATSVGTGFPWAATPVSTNNIQIHNINIDVRFENHPGSTACGINGATTSLTGTLSSGGTFFDNTHVLHLTSAPGLTSVSPQLGDQQAFGNGTIRDTQQTLRVN